MDFSPDIKEFVRLRFRAEQHQQVMEVLQCPALSTPRVMRSVLFLANGSLSMLKHYRAKAEKDVRTILVEAEYITDISNEPLFVRDMSAPFSDERNLGPKKCAHHATDVNPSADAPGRRANSAHHRNICGRAFVLGEVQYTIMEYQTSSAYVYCQRRTSQGVRVARLPLIFVLEQLAEYIEIKPMAFARV
jgi:hypothetical protein